VNASGVARKRPAGADSNGESKSHPDFTLIAEVGLLYALGGVSAGHGGNFLTGVFDCLLPGITGIC
jgi:p-aminobenzoyl-glutamate transporter AbgT